MTQHNIVVKEVLLATADKLNSVLQFSHWKNGYKDDAPESTISNVRYFSKNTGT